MSYILDALKRADAERERGAAPGLRSHHQMPIGNAGTPSARRAVWMTLAAGLILVGLASVFWFARSPDAPPMTAMTPTASQMQTSAAPASPQPMTATPASEVAATAPATVTPSHPRAAITPIAPVPIVLAEAPVAKAKPADQANSNTVTEAPGIPALPATPAMPATPAATVAATPAATPAGTVAPAPAPTPASAATSAPAASTPLLSELPTELRSRIPKITITGSVYSDSPAQRLLLVNNLVLTQGGQVAPDLKLEEIQPRSSVFSYKGARFRVMH